MRGWFGTVPWRTLNIGMGSNHQQRQATLSWLFVGLLFVLCGALGVLQYRWIGEVSIAARDRMHASLQAGLDRVSRDFQAELTAACRAIAPEDAVDPAKITAQVAARYAAWKGSGHQAQMFRAVGVASRQDDAIVLRLAGADGRLETAPWPDEWKAMHEFLQEMPVRESRGRRGGMPGAEPGTAFELPVFNTLPPMPGFSERDAQRRGIDWLVFDLNLKYVGGVVLPELLQRHLGAAGTLEYQFEIVPRGSQTALYSSDPDPQSRIAANADASAGIFDVSPDMLRPRGRGGRGFGLDGPRGPGGPGGARWDLFVRHRSGSLEAVVAGTRQRNLAVTAGVLLLIIASAAALIRFTRRAQRLAELQMNFVAGVSHELRTPLTVINTAAYNLQSSVSRNPEQVAKYGALIRQESGRLKELVEQVLSFAGSKAGRITQEAQPLAVEEILEASMDATRTALESGHFVLEKHIAPGLPLIAGDPRALQHALQNLLSNAVKYGAGNGASNWIGVSAAESHEGGRAMIEIRVADHGPGIPADEQKQIFDPFFRGKRALQDQVHGTGLGLTLVKEIVTAHRGTIVVRSQPETGTEFVVRLPVAPKEYQDEFANSTSRG